MKTIVTIPPYAPYLQEVADHPNVEGLRLNTVMPIKESLEDMLSRLKNIAQEKPVYLDLKCRQLRVARGAYFNAPKKPFIMEVNGKKVVLDPSNPKAHGELRTPPWSVVELDHEIELDTTEPVRCYLNDGLQSAYIARVDGNRLIMLDGPQRIVGGGESINIMHPSLKIKGYLTENDKKYIAAAKKVGMHDYMLSYVEKPSDIEELLQLDPQANIVAKIESKGGLDLIKNEYKTMKYKPRLMAARGDLFVEVGRPHRMLSATRKIIEADKEAIAASRICSSLREGYQPSCPDISDIGYLTEIGYQHCMVGDDVCFNRDSVISTLNLIQAIDKEYKPRKKKNNENFSGPKKKTTDTTTKLYGGNKK